MTLILKNFFVLSTRYIHDLFLKNDLVQNTIVHHPPTEAGWN